MIKKQSYQAIEYRLVKLREK